MILYPEINLAKRVVAKYKLTPPIDLEWLVSKYATIEELPFPTDADGITINLKVSGKIPHIILNQTFPHKRKRFTLAHELGHVIIPWHSGTIIDVADIPHKYDPYSVMEAEAHRFAAELLMPADWLLAILAESDSPEVMVRRVAHDADVSSLAATIKIINALPAGYIYANVDHDGEVLSSGRSEGTIANPPEWHKIIHPEEVFPFCSEHYGFSLNGSTYHWWAFNSELEVPSCGDNRSWEEILGSMLEDIGLYGLEAKRYSNSLNGCIGYANSRVRGDERSNSSVYSACLQRLHSKPEFNELLQHPDFEAYLVKRVIDLMQPK